MRRILVWASAAVLLLVCAFPSSGATCASVSPSVSFVPSLEPASSGFGPVPYYDEQLGLTLPTSSTGVAYNVTAVPQSDQAGFGPAYLVNGFTDGGLWYQVGLAYDWPDTSGGHVPGFTMAYVVFNTTTRTPVYPTGAQYNVPLSGPVRPGDDVLLALAFAGKNVTMSVFDWQTGARAARSYFAAGSEFVGLPTQNFFGFFTGLMTEWYHSSPYFGRESEVVYSTSKGVPSGTLWASEFNTALQGVVEFNYVKQVSFSDPSWVHPVAYGGAQLYADSTLFITGSIPSTLLTLSYSLLPGGLSPSRPILAYDQGGRQEEAALTETPVTFFVDNGTAWRVTPPRSAYPAAPWTTPDTTDGTASALATETIRYSHDF